MRHHLDKQVDVRCPDCGYRMVGLFDTRCPECGKQYALDELLARQGFERPLGAVPPPIPTAAGTN
jgi:DNA-directed RNA polymerase subunit RPC12/RpoP